MPFFVQEDYQCGPAALASALNAAGVKVTPEQLAPQVYLPRRGGSIQVELMAATRRRGLIAYQIAPSLEALLREVAAGSPVVVLQNLSLSWMPRWHYAVVVGYDLRAQTVLLRSGTARRLSVALATFEHTWKRSHHWGMLALPPTGLPRGADERSYLQAVLGLESMKQFTAASIGYQTALARWPASVGARIGLGNTSYALGSLAEAETQFRIATEIDSNSAVAWNNLAELLAQRHQLEQARAAAERAVSLGGPHAPAAEETLAEIRKRLSER